MFERFTDRARRVVVAAQEEARLLGHAHIGTEHILLSLLSVGDGTAIRILHRLGASHDGVRDFVVGRVGAAGESPGHHIPFTPRAKKVLELSLREALRLKHRNIGSEHILLGLLREGDGLAAQALVAVGVDLRSCADDVVAALAAGPVEEGRDLGPLAARCTSSGAAAVLQAAAEASATGGPAEPVHLLVALGRDTGPAGRALAGAGLGYERLRELLPVGDPDPEAAPARAGDDLAAAVETARDLATTLDGAPSRPGPNHLLVVLLSPHPWGVAPQVADLGVDPDALRRTVLQTL